MSFILDALKKSELERQRQSVPGLMDARIVQRNRRLPIWAAALGVLLGINLVVLAFVVIRKGAPAEHAPPPVAVPSASAGASAAKGTEHFSPLDAAPVFAPEIPVAADEAPSPPARAVAPAAQGTPPAAQGTPARLAHQADPLLTDRDSHPDNLEVLPSISEISLTGGDALPELHLDVHVYATNPAERFVYINMRKYHEGGTLQEGPAVEHIRRDGVVLNYRGLRFLLPRQP
jgi:general secretion pathway protein B